MTTADISRLARVIEECIAAQDEAVALWHAEDPVSLDVPPGPADEGLFRLLAREEHLTNFRLWHVEDEARRRDVGPEVIADCKRRIDGLNQRRNDLIERLDACLNELLAPLLPPLPSGVAARYNTETVGGALDRLSILNLKIYHMREQCGREDAAQAHRDACAAKVSVMLEQRRDLTAALTELLAEYAAGTKRPKIYRQFKMYNDPSLNPALYAGKGLKPGA